MTRRGKRDEITSQRARPRVVIALVTMHGLALAIFLGVPAVAAAFDGEAALAGCLGAAALASVAAFLLQRRLGPVATPHKIEGLVAVATAFLAASLLAAPGFAALGLSPVSAVFESVSGITTTGLSVAGDTAAWPLSAHFLRAWLQWSGGFAFAALAIALVVGRGMVALRLGLAERPGETLLGSTMARARAVLSAYLAVSAVAVAAGMLAADSPAEGALIALAAISTGGFAPAADSLAGTGLALQGVAAAAMLAGAVSMTLYAAAWRGGLRALSSDVELRALIAVTAGLALAAIAVEAIREGGAAPLDIAFSVLSAQSTAGFTTVDIAAFSPATLVLLIAAMAIGGSLGSTAGGIKVFRALFAASAARATLVRTALSPNTVTGLRVMGEPAEPNEGTTVFGLFFLYIGAVLVLWFLLLLAGYAPLPALFDTVSALSTVGLSAGAIGPEMGDGLKLAVAAAMLLGRLEFLAFLALLRPRTWTT